MRLPQTSQSRMFQCSSLHFFGLSKFSWYGRSESFEEKCWTLIFCVCVRESFLEESIICTDFEEAGGASWGRRPGVGGEIFLQRKKLVPSMAWRLEELGLLMQLQGLSVAWKVVGSGGWRQRREGRWAGPPHEGLESKSLDFIPRILRGWEETAGFKQRSSLMRYGFLKETHGEPGP